MNPKTSQGKRIAHKESGINLQSDFSAAILKAGAMLTIFDGRLCPFWNFSPN
jgi:hypothetical protein